MEIRPNPAMEFINIEVTCCESETSLEEVVVNNVLGTTVYFAKNILTQNSTRISCANWSSGSYFVTVKLSDGSIYDLNPPLKKRQSHDKYPK
jgi:hypothetical protein